MSLGLTWEARRLSAPRSRVGAQPLLQVDVDGVQVGHFFGPDDIELDIDPSQVAGEEAFLAIVDLMRKLGRTLNRDRN
jgi:hypothetical protein